MGHAPMPEKNNAKSWIALAAGLAVGWIVMHLIVTHWNELKALIKG